MPSRHLLVAISAHGFGHLAQVAPIINRLLNDKPDLKLTIKSDLPGDEIQRRIHGEFTHLSASDDTGLAMMNAVSVDRHRSMEFYANLHAEWGERLEKCTREFAAIGADLVLADTEYGSDYPAQVPGDLGRSVNHQPVAVHFGVDDVRL